MVYHPNGVVYENWVPNGEGSAFEFSRVLTPFQKFRDRTVVVTGLADNTAEAIAGIRAELARGGPVEDVDGLAGSAFWGADQLHVFHDGRDYLTVSVVGFGDSRSAARRVAEAAIGHL